ncbi:MAG: archease [Candidatus Omnitrophica bacterium]|nr:archease [Candidatus Omnitrophota bacterium]
MTTTMTASPARGFKTFDHTADIGLEIWGDTFEAIYEESAKGLFSLMAKLSQVEPHETRTIELKEESGEELLMVWLKELLFIFDTEHLLLSQFQVVDITFNHLTAKVSGEKLDSAKHQLGREVKAVTRHLFEFKKTSSGFSARVILDI